MSALHSDDSDDATSQVGPDIGTVLEDRYELTGHLGEGGVGWVYRARHLRLGTDVAIKMLQAPYQQHEMLRPRFEREAKVLAELRHPHIVTLTDYSVDDRGRPYLVMELLEGRTLGELIDEGTVGEARARRILEQILDALTYAHGRGFAHRDLKPTNVFLVELPTERDHVKLLDFGFVKLTHGNTDSQPDLTRSGIAFGTPGYMSPEQATGGETGTRVDLYASGVILFEMLAGRRPFVGEIPDVIRQHLTEPVPPLSVGGAALLASPQLRALLNRAMAKDPGDRYADAAEMRAALNALPVPCCERLDSGEGFPRGPITAKSKQARRTDKTDPATPALTQARRRRNYRGAAIAAVVLVALLAGGYWLAQQRNAAIAGGTTADATAGESTDGDRATPETDDDAVDMDLTDLRPEDMLPPSTDANLPAGQDPWTTGERVALLESGRRVIDAGRPLSPPAEQALRRYVREHRRDVRVHLLLAGHFVERGYDTAAVQRYELAMRVDPRTRFARRTLPDLVRLSSSTTASTSAGAMIIAIYGRSALPTIDRRLASGRLEPDAVARLRRVRNSVANAPE